MTDDPLELPGELPSSDDFQARLHDWLTGTLDRAGIRAWAERWVDAHVLPDLPPEDPASTHVETLMVLSSSLPIGRGDIEALQAFVDAPDGGERAWADWHAHVATTDWAARRA